jgi:transposase
LAGNQNWREYLDWVNWVELFCDVDDFCLVAEPLLRKRLLEDGTRHRNRERHLTASEIMTIVIAFHHSKFRDFKHFYMMLTFNHRTEFPDLVSYQRFVALMPSVIVLLFGYLQSRFGTCTGIAFIDSTKLAVCGNKRINRNRVFQGVARLGKTTMGWFFGFKLHLIINECGELLAIRLTPGNVDDREPVPDMARELVGKLFGDKGYISAELFWQLWDRGLQLVTPIRKNMKNSLMPLLDKVLLRKRSVIETVNDQLKNISQIEHTRHRSRKNFVVNLIAGLIAYTHQPKKPSLRITPKEQALLAAA